MTLSKTISLILLPIILVAIIIYYSSSDGEGGSFITEIAGLSKKSEVDEKIKSDIFYIPKAEIGKKRKALPGLMIRKRSPKETVEAYKDLGDRFSHLTEEKLKRTSSMNFTSLHFADDHFEYLQNMKNVSNLNLSNTKITDVGLQGLQQLPNLKHLVMVNARITDVGLAIIGEIKTLRRLNLSGCHVSKAARKRLKALLPKVDITF